MNESQKQALGNYILADAHYKATNKMLEDTREAEIKARNKRWAAYIALREAFAVEAFDSQGLLVELVPRLAES